MSATNFPKDEVTFFVTDLTIDEMVKHYTFHELMAMFIFGKNTMEKLDYIVKNNLFEECEVHPFQVLKDKSFFHTKTFVIQLVLEKMNACEVVLIESMSNVVILYNN
jgi:uracil DNA glycosylase